ncbi:MAG: L-dopachrome tautomerase-related protein [Bermanella sp.]
MKKMISAFSIFTLATTLIVSTQLVRANNMEIQTVATYTDTRPGNITVTPKGRIIMSQQPLDGPSLRVVEILPDGSKIPFPNLDWADGPESGKVGISATIGVASDKHGVVWILDMGGKNSPAQIIAWDTQKNQLHKKITLPKNVITPISFLQDFALDEKRGYLYIADMTFPAPGAKARPAFVVVNLQTGKARRILEGAKPLMPVRQDVVINGSLMGTQVENGQSAPWHLGLNPIAIDPSFSWVYFGTVNGKDVYRIPAKTLADTIGNEASTPKSVMNKIERYGPKPASDGIAVDDKGQVFVSDIEASAVGITTPDGYRIIAEDSKRLAWPDGFAFGPDGYLYVTQNQLNAHPALNEGKDDSLKPYHVVKLKI